MPTNETTKLTEVYQLMSVGGSEWPKTNHSRVTD